MTDALPILVPVDDRLDLRALEWAKKLAQVSDTPIRVVSVVGHPDLTAGRHQMIKEAVGDESVEVTVLLHDDVASAIVEGAAASSLVCMTTAATLLPHGGHFGSIAEEVVRTIARPVVLFGPRATADFEAKRVVVPVDGSKPGEYVLEAAAQFADILDAEVWVVTVEAHDQEVLVAAVAGADAGALESGYVRRVARDVSRRATNEAQFEVLHGPDPARSILAFAEPDGIVAMSTHGRSGLRRIFAGSVTTHVVADAHRPTLVVRPPADALSEA